MRHLFPGDLHLLSTGLPAVNAPYTFWSDAQSGVQYADILAGDGVTPITEFTTNSEGLRPYVYGPDNIEVMYVDTGVSIRFPVYADDRLKAVLDDPFLATIESRLSALESGQTGGGSGGGVSDHGALSGLGDDDHAQYLNNARGDLRYYTRSAVDAALTTAAGAASTEDRKRSNHTGVQAVGTIEGLVDSAGRFAYTRMPVGHKVTVIWDETAKVWKLADGTVISADIRSDILYDCVGGRRTDRLAFMQRNGSNHDVTIA